MPRRTRGGRVVLHRPEPADVVIGSDVQEERLPDAVRELLGRSVVLLSVTPSGDLTLSLDDATLTCTADPSYESWQLYGPQGQVVVCGPGGALTEWGPRRQ